MQHRSHQILVILLLLFLSNCTRFQPTDRQTEVDAIIKKANQEFYLDHRIWFQDIQGTLRGQQLVLTGEAFFKGPVAGIEKKLKRAGFENLELVDRVNYLPESFPGDRAFAVVTVPYVMGRYQAVDEKQEGTQMLYGEPIRLIRDADNYFQVQSSTGYLGYIPKTSVRTMDLAEWERYHRGQHALLIRNVRLANGTEIGLGSRLPYLGQMQVLLADGSIATLDPADMRITDPAANPLRQQIIHDAERFLGLPYVWGGRSGDGVDCSGFVMQSYLLNDILLPRDTDEMSGMGRMIGFPGWMNAMLPGDLLFFQGSRRLVTHVALYMGEGKVIHSLGKGVQIDSLDPESDQYAAGLHDRFIFAKRIFE